MELSRIDEKNTLHYELLLLADPSRARIDSYVNKGTCIIAEESNQVIGIYVMSQPKSNTVEIMNIAVLPQYQNKGTGRKLIEDAKRRAISDGFSYLEIGTGNSSIGQLALYQKCGFRIVEIVPDFFTNNYPELIIENGIVCRDMIRLRMTLKNNTIEGNYTYDKKLDRI